MLLHPQQFLWVFLAVLIYRTQRKGFLVKPAGRVPPNPDQRIRSQIRFLCKHMQVSMVSYLQAAADCGFTGV